MPSLELIDNFSKQIAYTEQFFLFDYHNSGTISTKILKLLCFCYKNVTLRWWILDFKAAFI